MPRNVHLVKSYLLNKIFSNIVITVTFPKGTVHVLYILPCVYTLCGPDPRANKNKNTFLFFLFCCIRVKTMI